MPPSRDRSSISSTRLWLSILAPSLRADRERERARDPVSSHRRAPDVDVVDGCDDVLVVVVVVVVVGTFANHCLRGDHTRSPCSRGDLQIQKKKTRGKKVNNRKLRQTNKKEDSYT